MPIIQGASRLSVVVDPTRIKGNRRVFKNVIPASSAGMSYDPAKYDLQVVHEPRVGYRMISLPDIVEILPTKDQKQSRNTLNLRGWFPEDGEVPALNAFNQRPE